MIWPTFVLYSKPGCHLCEELEAKLQQIPEIRLEVRDINAQSDWHDQYAFEIPVLCWLDQHQDQPLPRLSPQMSVEQIKRVISQSLSAAGQYQA